MPQEDHPTRPDLSEGELASRRTLFQITEEDLKRLAALRPFAERNMDAVVEEFYAFLLSHHEARAFLTDDVLVRRLKRTQRQYFLDLFSGVCDLRYMEDRLRVGSTHERIGLPTKIYLCAYSHYLRLIHARLANDIPDPSQAEAAFRSIEKLVMFDITLAIDAYIAANVATIRRHQAAIRELSTPVIRVYDGILLLPLIGAIDSLRAEQIMETALLRVVEEQARVLIMDIAGVSVVDTQVADHLLKTTAAVRLLGAQTILTGISAQVARTIVQLGVEINTMHTRSRLADGIELALSMIGRSITARAGQI